MYARARHSEQMLSGCPPGCSSRPQLTQLSILELYTSSDQEPGPRTKPGSVTIPVVLSCFLLRNQNPCEGDWLLSSNSASLSLGFAFWQDLLGRLGQTYLGAIPSPA